MPPKRLQERLVTIAKIERNRIDRKLQRWRVQAAGLPKDFLLIFISRLDKNAFLDIVAILTADNMKKV